VGGETPPHKRGTLEGVGIKKRGGGGGGGGLLWSNCVCDRARMYLYVFLSTTRINILH